MPRHGNRYGGRYLNLNNCSVTDVSCRKCNDQIWVDQKFKPNVNMVKDVTRWKKSRQKNVVKCEAAKVQWSANDMLPIKSDQSGCEVWKKEGGKVKRGFNLREAITVAFTVMGYFPCSLQIRTLSCDSDKTQKFLLTSIIFCGQMSWIPGSLNINSSLTCD